jgi:hypothetical protein
MSAIIACITCITNEDAEDCGLDPQWEQHPNQILCEDPKGCPPVLKGVPVCCVIPSSSCPSESSSSITFVEASEVPEIPVIISSSSSSILPGFTPGEGSSDDGGKEEDDYNSWCYIECIFEGEQSSSSPELGSGAGLGEGSAGSGAEEEVDYNSYCYVECLIPVESSAPSEVPEGSADPSAEGSEESEAVGGIDFLSYCYVECIGDSSSG